MSLCVSPFILASALLLVHDPLPDVPESDYPVILEDALTWLRCDDPIAFRKGDKAILLHRCTTAVRRVAIKQKGEFREPILALIRQAHCSESVSGLVHRYSVRALWHFDEENSEFAQLLQRPSERPMAALEAATIFCCRPDDERHQAACLAIETLRTCEIRSVAIEADKHARGIAILPAIRDRLESMGHPAERARHLVRTVGYLNNVGGDPYGWAHSTWTIPVRWERLQLIELSHSEPQIVVDELRALDLLPNCSGSEHMTPEEEAEQIRCSLVSTWSQAAQEAYHSR